MIQLVVPFNIREIICQLIYVSAIHISKETMSRASGTTLAGAAPSDTQSDLLDLPLLVLSSLPSILKNGPKSHCSPGSYAVAVTTGIWKTPGSYC